MKNKKHLPFFGVGPFIASFQVAITIIGVILSHFGYIYLLRVDFLNIPFKIIGAFFIAFGVYLFYGAHYKAKLFNNVAENNLVTTGVYSIVRNPIYSGFFIGCAGLVLMANNLFLLIIPFICWIFMTVVLKYTEEKWLKNLYGDEYINYCKKVNRCIPWF